MRLKRKGMLGRSKTPISTIIMYTCSTVVTLIAVAFLLNNIFLFKDTVTQYVAQGYSADEVVKQLVPSQLLPGIFEPIAIYGGIALILFSAGLINHKISYSLKSLDDVEIEAGDTDISKQDDSENENAKDVEDAIEIAKETDT
ncbi:hypothetical protein [Desulfosporosinus sp. BG]|uniref:hypothetical protein n=1 Tax=Desulfosporosinus sp. BG TaxID=1633135 RepID=UPI00083B587B|nr:hypothetical protein [Desulfosporosinus sp. BG]ODA42451.1 putative membrane protein [Desulfosporosinus sp. BG]